MDRIDMISMGMFVLVIMGVIGMYIGAVDLAGVITIEGLAVAVSIAAGQLQKYKCQLCPLYLKEAAKDTSPNAPGCQ